MHKSAAGASEDEDGRQREKSGSIAENAPSKGPRTDGDARQESALNQDGQEQDGQEQAGTDMEMQIVENPLEVSHRDELVMITTRDNAFNNPLRSPTLPFVQAGQPLSMEGSRLPIIHSQIDLDGMTLIETDTDKFPAFSSSEAPTTSVPPTFDPDSRTPTVGSSFQLRTVEAHDENIQDPFSLSNYELCYANSTATGTWSDFPATDVHYLSQFEFVPEEPRYEGPKFHVARENSWKIEKACLRYLARHYNIRGLEPASHNNRRDISQYGGLRAAIAALDCNDVVVEDVAKLAVNILCKTSGFGQYIYGVGAYKDMEKVFRWRLSPSTRNRQLISEPFQPTSLQYMGHCNYDASIDFINWASIRDQLIYKAGTYDLNQVVADIVANTVIEIPERRVAINIHDTFFTKIFARTAATCSTRYSYLYPPWHASILMSSWLCSDLGVRNNLLDNGISEVWESDFVGQTSLSWTTADVFSYITKQIGALNVSRKSNSDLTTFDNCHPSLYSHRLTLALAQPLATKWGLDKLYRWKLSREFAQAYPFLDCTGGECLFIFQ